MFFVFSLLQIKLCAHDEFMTNDTIKFVDKAVDISQWNNIRILLDFRFFYESSTDKYTCRYKGQKLQFNNKEFTCGEEDVLSSFKRVAAIETLLNVKSFVERFIKVNPVIAPIQIQNYTNETSFVDEFAYGSDLHITILTRPVSYINAVAAGIPTSVDSTYKRPLTGVIILNPSQIPPGAQSEKTNRNRYFYALLHQMIHVLGFSTSLIEHFHPVGSNGGHQFLQARLKKNGRDFHFLTAPNSYIFAKKHYGVDTFKGDGNSNCRAGIEFEDAPGQGSHLESRTFYTEVMTAGNYLDVGEQFSFYRLTDATMAILQDTGNYKCDYKMAQPLLWGNPLLNEGKPIENFAIGPPQTTFPKYYLTLTKEQGEPSTAFDFKHHGVLKATAFDCNGAQKDTQFCKAQQFYNPKNSTQFFDDQINDYMIQPPPIITCGKGQAMLPNDYQYNDLVKCAEYKCDGYKSFKYELTIDYELNKKEEIQCNKSNIDTRITRSIITPGDSQGVNFWCPDPERFCRTMELYDKTFTEDPLSQYV